MNVAAPTVAKGALMAQAVSRCYIVHEDTETPSNGIAYFGPFEESELTERLNDAVGNMFANSGDIDEVRLTDAEASQIFINSRQSWMAELARLTN